MSDENIFNKFLTSGRLSNSSNEPGIGKGSVLALDIFFTIKSLSSLSSILVIEDESDFDIFFEPSLKDIILADPERINGSGIEKKLSPPKSE